MNIFKNAFQTTCGTTVQCTSYIGGKKNFYFDICIKKKQSELATSKTKQ